MSTRAERAKRRKARREPKGQSVSFTVQQGPKVELVQGSLKTLKMRHGDLLVVRLSNLPSDEVHKAILRRVSEILRETGRRSTAVVMPSEIDFDLIPYETAAELLREITAKKEKEDPNGNDS